MLLVTLVEKPNVLRETGGPFGAAIFPADGRRPVAVGTNGVPRLHNSVAHAEPVAIMAAEAFLDNEVFTATKAPRSSTSTSSTAGRSTTDRLTAWTSS